MMTTATENREKAISKLPPWLRQTLKVRAAQLDLEMQTAVEQAISRWCALASTPELVDTTGARSFATWLPPGQWDQFRTRVNEHGIATTQGLAQAVNTWLQDHPAPTIARPTVTRRIIVCNQKGGVGKTSISAGVGEALAESDTELYRVAASKHLATSPSEQDNHDKTDKPGLGQRVLLIDFDPQCHLTTGLGFDKVPMEGDSLTKHMAGESTEDLNNLIVHVSPDQYGDRLSLLRGCTDAFLLDVKLASVRARESALERALSPIEADYDAIVVDCPPSLGISMDAAAYYGRRRESEHEGASGPLIVVQAEDTSADAYNLLISQIEDLHNDLAVNLDYLGLAVNLYDPRRGYVTTSSLEQWLNIPDPAVVGVIGDVKEQREARRAQQPLLAYAPRSEQAMNLRALTRTITP